MTLAEAVLDVEGWFNVHTEVGYAEGYSDQRGRPFGTAETRDMETAPCGEPYAVVVSGGVYTDGPMPMLFHHEGEAIQFWRYAVEDYADLVAPGGKWKELRSLHLYWRDKPIFERQTYVALDQAGMLRDRSKLASQLTVDMGIVWSRLLISRLDPDGKE